MLTIASLSLPLFSVLLSAYLYFFVFPCLCVIRRLGDKTAARIKWACAEALRNINRRYFGTEGLVMAIHQDARDMRICVRFTACNDALEFRAGLLAMVDLRSIAADAFAENLADAFVRAVELACTVRRSPPRKTENREPDDDDIECMARVCEAIEVFNADAASDEQLAGNILRGRRLGDLGLNHGLLPAVKIIHKDKAHASRRIISRAVAADPFLQSIHWSITGKDSFIQRVQWSSALKQVFNQHSHLLDMPRAKQLGACKPRWESSTAPYRRRVLLHEAHSDSPHSPNKQTTRIT